MDQRISLAALVGYQIPNPFKDDVKFEEFIVDLFNELEATTSYDRFGRSGQKQSGIDVYSIECQTVIQCKLKLIDRPDKKIIAELIDEFDKDFAAFKKYRKSKGVSYNRFIFATTFKNDVKLVTHIARCAQQSKPNDIKVEYWSWEKLSKVMPSSVHRNYYEDFSREVGNYYSTRDVDLTKFDQHPIDEKLEIIDQLSQFVSTYYEEVNFIPLHILKQMYPFRIKGTNYPSYELFTLTTNNPKLFDFLESLQIDDDNLNFTSDIYITSTENAEKKTKNFLHSISANLVFNIRNEIDRKELPTRYFKNKTCNCVRCNFLKGDYISVFKQLETIPDSADEKLKHAYIFYKVGAFIKAANLLLEVADEANKTHQPTLKFIAKYDLKKLRNFLQRYNYDNIEANKLGETIKSIDINQEFVLASSSLNKPILEWINNRSFYNEAFFKIQSNVSNIRDQYYSSLNGGWSTNSHVWALINAFAEIDAFINQNFIFFDAYLEYGQLVNLAIEGMFASHGIKESQGNRLAQFDDWLIQQMIFYGSGEKILTYFNRYKLNGINYKRTSQGDSLVERFINLIDQYDDTLLAYRNLLLKEYYFIEQLEGYFDRALIMCSLCNIESEEICMVADKLINHLSVHIENRPNRFSHVELFFNWQNKHFNRDLIERFFKLSLLDTNSAHSELLDGIVDRVAELGISLKADSDTIAAIEGVIDQLLLNGNIKLAEILTNVFRMIDSSVLKMKISHSIDEFLQKSFRSDLYYTCALYGVLGIDTPFFETLLNGCIPVEEEQHNSILRTMKNGNRYLDMLIDIGYKYQLNFRNERFKELWGISDYYDWQLDMSGFDYSKFDPYWATEVKGPYKFVEMRKNPEVSEKIVEVLRQRKDPYLKEALTYIQCVRVV